MTEPSSALDLDALIAVATSQSDDTPLGQLAAAARLKELLDERGDALLGHFVDQARRSGCSWSDIGGALDLSKQAVQQRHRKSDLSRFTPRAASVIDHARSLAVELGHGFVGTEHLLLGICSEPESIGAKILGGSSLDLAAATAAIVARAGRGSTAVEDPVMTPKAKRALEAALAQALDLGHNYIGTEHQLLGLLAIGDGLANDVLIERGLTYDAARESVIDALSGLGGSS